MLDARRSLKQLNQEWSKCRACDLGLRREATGGQFVAGEGTRRGVMFIGEGPGENEEAEGRPFIGRSGIVLRKFIEKLGLQEYYITNVVTCRSCSPFLDAQGSPRFRRNRGGGPPLPMLKDEAPLPTHVASCLPRVHEEIYLVDPVIIVTLGGTATEAILNHPVTITRDRGQTEHCYIPGASFRPVLTEKKGAWARKIHGQLEMPVEQNEVMYEVMPTLHPAFALRKKADMGVDSPMRLLFKDVRFAVKIYEQYMLDAFGRLPNGNSDVSDENIEMEFYED